MKSAEAAIEAFLGRAKLGEHKKVSDTDNTDPCDNTDPVSKTLDSESEDDLYLLALKAFQAGVPVTKDWVLSAAQFMATETGRKFRTETGGKFSTARTTREATTDHRVLRTLCSLAEQVHGREGPVPESSSHEGSQERRSTKPATISGFFLGAPFEEKGGKKVSHKL